MSNIEHHGLIMPSSPEDRKRVATMMKEAVNCMIRIKSEQDAKKDIINRIVEDYNLPKKIISKAASTMYKDEQQKVLAEYDDLETFLDVIQNTVPAPSATDTSPTE